MATVDDILTEVYRIVRDPGRTATTEAVALKMMSHAHRAINVFSRSVVIAVNMPTTANQTLYTHATTLAKVELVRDGNRDLPRFELSQLWARDKNWRLTQGDRFAVWSRIGRQVVAIVPCKTSSDSVTLIGPSNFPDFTTISDVIAVRDDQLENLAELTEALFTLRLRLFPAFKSVMERLGQKFSVTPLQLFSPGLTPTDSSERAAGIAPGDMPDLDQRQMQIEQNRPGAK